MRGHLFENMVIIDYIKNAFNNGINGGFYFYRDSNGNEVDFMIKKGSKYDCFEIKSSSTFHQDFMKGLKSFENAFPELVREKKIIYSGENMPVINGISILNYRHCD